MRALGVSATSVMTVDAPGFASKLLSTIGLSIRPTPVVTFKIRLAGWTGSPEIHITLQGDVQNKEKSIQSGVNILAQQAANAAAPGFLFSDGDHSLKTKFVKANTTITIGRDDLLEHVSADDLYLVQIISSRPGFGEWVLPEGMFVALAVISRSLLFLKSWDIRITNTGLEYYFVVFGSVILNRGYGRCPSSKFFRQRFFLDNNARWNAPEVVDEVMFEQPLGHPAHFMFLECDGPSNQSVSCRHLTGSQTRFCLQVGFSLPLTDAAVEVASAHYMNCASNSEEIVVVARLLTESLSPDACVLSPTAKEAFQNISEGSTIEDGNQLFQKYGNYVVSRVVYVRRLSFIPSICSLLLLLLFCMTDNQNVFFPPFFLVFIVTEGRVDVTLQT